MLLSHPDSVQLVRVYDHWHASGRRKSSGCCAGKEEQTRRRENVREKEKRCDRVSVCQCASMHACLIASACVHVIVCANVNERKWPRKMKRRVEWIE